MSSNEQLTDNKRSQYERLIELFEKYKDHEFKPFERVLMYFRDRMDIFSFTIVPHVVWYYDAEEKKHIMYDPIVHLTGGSLIPFEGNEEFIGFHGNHKILKKIKDGLI